MDPLTAIGLASNILSFIELGVKVVSGAIDIYGSASGLTREAQTSEAIATQMRYLSSKLQQPRGMESTGEEQALYALAAECLDISENIVGLIEKARPKDSKSKVASVRASLTSKWHQSDRRRLEERLHQCRSQLSLQLNYLTSSEVLTKLDVLVASAEKDTTVLDRLSGQLNDVRLIASSGPLSPEGQSQIGSLVGVSERVANIIAQQCVLKSLEFADMHSRYGAVDDAHDETYRWIYGNRSDGEEDSIKTTARGALHSWLSAGTGVFHVSGKLGSGKSTLMKYLCDHPSTKVMLKEWAGPRDLISASFFFWKPGSALQKSLTGLLRSLIHDILQTCPQLVEQIFPDQWSQITSTPWQAREKIRFLDREIRQAFSRLVSDSKLYGDRCFCFFIDGLDEYEGTIQDDTRFLVDQLCSWATFAPDNIKLCVSSREYNVFMNAFQESKRIRLHELTLSDMRVYVSDKLRCLDTEQDKEKIMHHVVENAQGIFLWVALVVKMIREQAENGTSTEDVLREIDVLPRELDDLFAYLLDSLSGSDLRNAYQTFLILQCTKQHPDFQSCYFSLLALSFLDDYNRDPLFAMREGFKADPLEITTRLNMAKKRLNGYCRGLVDIVSRTCCDQSLDVVGFTHRSVPEFLSSPDRKGCMPSSLADFDALDALSQLKLAELSAYPHFFGYDHRSCFDPVPTLIFLRMERNLDSTQYQFFEALSKAAPQHPLDSSDGAGRPDTELPMEHFDDWDGGGAEIYLVRSDCVYEVGYHRGRLFKSSDNEALQLPIYYATFLGNFGYATWKLQHYDRTADRPINLQILLVCAICSAIFREADGQSGPSNSETQDFVDFVDVLIRGGLTPLSVTRISLLTFDVYEKRLDSSEYQPKLQMTAWHVILVECYIAWSQGRLVSDLQWVRHILERYLEHGADPHFAFTVTDIDPSIIAGCRNNRRKKDGPSIRALNLFVGRERRELLVEVAGDHLRDGFIICQAKSLVEYLEFFKDHFENWDRILQLVDRNLKNSGGPVQSEADATEESISVEEGNNGMDDHPQGQSTAPDRVRPEPPGETETIMQNKTEAVSQGATRSPIAKHFSVAALLPLGILAFGIFVALTIQLWLVRAS